MTKHDSTKGSSYSPTIDGEKSLLERSILHLESSGLQKETLVLGWLVVVLVRWLVGQHSYSGANTPPMFGDYEAQRHWMEITLNLPISDWYFNTTQNDLLYWGLDYPPLTAYVSYAFGYVAHQIEPEMVALATSRGYESPTSKVFMRLSVLFCDVLLFFPAIYYIARVMYRMQERTKQTAFILLVLLQPSLMLIDHGHFQYNNVCIGFTAAAVALILSGYEFLGSIAYCFALNFKQMALYYAPAFGIFLISRCLYRSHFLLHVIKLGIAVITTFALLWWPFCIYTRASETCASSIGQVVHRIFPFARGLFEDKVANFWCVLDLVYKIKRHITPMQQMRLCTLATFAGFFPSIVDLLRRRPTKLRFLLALVNSSLSFFLFSYQVHEKSILLPLLPISFLYSHNSLLAGWFSCLSAFSMYFLLKKDGLIVPYYVLQLVYLAIGVIPFLTTRSHLHNQDATPGPGYQHNGTPHVLVRVYVMLSLVGMVVIHAAQILIQPPQRYPHIHDYVFAAYSCANFLIVLVYCTFWQWTVDHSTTEISKPKAKKE